MTTRTLPFPAPLDCAAVDERLADWLDDPAADPAVARHVAACARCGPLVDALRTISAEAAALPPLAPPAHLWDGIAGRLGAQEVGDRDVVPLPRAADSPPRVRVLRRRDLPPAWRLAAAAVALVAVTAGVTYRLARPAGPVTVAAAGDARTGPSRPASDAPSGAARDAVDAGVSATGMPDAGAGEETAPAAPGEAEGPARAADAQRVARAGRRPANRGADPALVAVSNPDAAVPGAAEYDREIAALRAAVRERRGELDSATVVVLVRNLRVIDQAIAQSRAALARDPHSPFLGDQLTRALGQKVDLLRTAALLPRT